jgi:hypothetical protein
MSWAILYKFHLPNQFFVNSSSNHICFCWSHTRWYKRQMEQKWSRFLFLSPFWETKRYPHEISGSHGGEYDFSFLRYSIGKSSWSRPTFQRCVLPPSSGKYFYEPKSQNVVIFKEKQDHTNKDIWYYIFCPGFSVFKLNVEQYGIHPSTAFFDTGALTTSF